MGRELWNERHGQRSAEDLTSDINASIELAASQGRWIDDLTAKRIARVIEPGGGALREFAETGAISPDMEADLEAALQAFPEAQLWMTELGLYCQHRRPKGAMSYWNEACME